VKTIRGSPGVPHVRMPRRKAYEVNDQRVLSLSPASASPILYGQVYEAGVTGASGASPLITAQLGYGPATVNPECEYGWT